MDQTVSNAEDKRSHKHTLSDEDECTKQMSNVHTEDSTTEDERKDEYQCNLKDLKMKKNSVDHEAQEKRICSVIGYFNIISVVLIIILGVIISNENSSPAPMTEFCFSRTMIEVHPYDREELKFCNTTHCCFEDLDATWKIIQYITSRWLKEKILKDPETKFMRYECDNKVNQHKTITGGSIKLTTPLHRARQLSTDCPACVLWNDTSDHAVLPKDNSFFTMHKENGSIEINRSGMYHVYSQVNIYYGENISKNFFHYVTLREYIYGKAIEKLLMKSVNSQCVGKNKPQLFSSYHGSDFYLHKGATLAVNVNSEAILAMPPGANFFGIHKL